MPTIIVIISTAARITCIITYNVTSFVPSLQSNQWPYIYNVLLFYIQFINIYKCLQCLGIVGLASDLAAVIPEVFLSLWGVMSGSTHGNISTRSAKFRVRCKKHMHLQCLPFSGKFAVNVCIIIMVTYVKDIIFLSAFVCLLVSTIMQ